MCNPFYLWWNWRPVAGLRFSVTDGIAIVLCALATWSAWPFLGEMAVVFPVVLGHFFLFCNVFRISRNLELLWSALFMCNVGIWAGLGSFVWMKILLTQTPVTILFIALTVFGEDYHGIGYSMVPWGRKCQTVGDVGFNKVSFGQRATK